MNNEVSRRFVACHDKLKEEGKIKSTRQFVLSLDYAPQSFSDILKGNRDVTIELVRKAVELYQFNATFLFSGIGDMFQCPKEQSKDPVIAVVTDKNGEELIMHVPISAQAGYGDHLYNVEFLEELPAFTLPGMSGKQRSYRCFDVDGQSMEPCLYHGDQVVCSFVERDYWASSLRDNCVYVIVTESSVLVKRVINNLTGDNTINLISDNDFFDPNEIHLSELREIWKVERKISVFNHVKEVESTFQDEMNSLKDVINHQSQMIKHLSQSIDSLRRPQQRVY